MAPDVVVEGARDSITSPRIRGLGYGKSLLRSTPEILTGNRKWQTMMFQRQSAPRICQISFDLVIPLHYFSDLEAGVDVNPSLSTRLSETIADSLRIHGSYQGEIESLGAQAIVDAQWAAHQAARAVGARVKVSVLHVRPDPTTTSAVLHVTSRSALTA